MNKEFLPKYSHNLRFSGNFCFAELPKTLELNSKTFSVRLLDWEEHRTCELINGIFFHSIKGEICLGNKVVTTFNSWINRGVNIISVFESFHNQQKAINYIELELVSNSIHSDKDNDYMLDETEFDQLVEEFRKQTKYNELNFSAPNSECIEEMILKAQQIYVKANCPTGDHHSYLGEDYDEL